MGHFLLNLVKSQSTKRCDVPRVSNVYLTTGKSYIEQNHRKEDDFYKDLETTKINRSVFMIVPKKPYY